MAPISTAAAAVFGTVELLEHILLDLDIGDLLKAARLSKQFSSVIAGSTSIQRAAAFLLANGVRRGGIPTCSYTYGFYKDQAGLLRSHAINRLFKNHDCNPPLEYPGPALYHYANSKGFPTMRVTISQQRRVTKTRETRANDFMTSFLTQRGIKVPDSPTIRIQTTYTEYVQTSVSVRSGSIKEIGAVAKHPALCTLPVPRNLRQYRAQAVEWAEETPQEIKDMVLPGYHARHNLMFKGEAKYKVL